jgi:hypothetical protein
MFWAFKVSYNEDFLILLWQLFWLLFQNLGAFLFQSSGHTERPSGVAYS